MASPTRAQVHIDAAATAFSVAYRNSAYIADQILPALPVAKQTGKYFKFTKSDWFRDEAGPRAPGARAPRGEWSMDTQGSYTCMPYSFGMSLPDEIVENADNPLDPVRTTVEFVTDKILLAREARVAAALFNATTFSGYTAAVTALSGGTGVAWSTTATSDPVGDIEVMRNNIIGQIGRKPNVMVVGQAVHTVLRTHPAIRSMLSDDSNRAIIPDAQLASVFDVDKYLVGRSIYTDSEEGTTASYSYIWGKYVLLAYVTPSPALMSPSLGYILNWKNRTAEQFREEQEHANVYTVEESCDEIVCSAQSGYLLSSVVA